MKISTKVRYGMRAMVELAQQSDRTPTMLSIIAKNQGLSEKYLEQIFTMLRTAGLVKSVRGSKGGYVLAKESAQTNLLEIFTALNGPLELVDCVDDRSCDKCDSCPTYPLWREITGTIKVLLESKMLADISDTGDVFTYSI